MLNVKHLEKHFRYQLLTRFTDILYRRYIMRQLFHKYAMLKASNKKKNNFANILKAIIS